MTQTQSQSITTENHKTEIEPLQLKQSTPCCIYCCSFTMLTMAILMLFLFDDFAFFYDFNDRADQLYDDKDVTHIPVGLHIFSAIITLLTGPIQIILGFQGKGKQAWHRWQGRLYVLTMIFSIPNAYALCFLTIGGNWQRWSLFWLATYWMFTLFFAVYYVKNGIFIYYTFYFCCLLFVYI